MSYFSWNCQGLWNIWTVQTLGHFLKEFHPHIIFLRDSRLGMSGIDNIKKNFNLFGICIPLISSSGSLALLWEKDVSVSITSYSKNYIDANVQLPKSDII